MHALNARQMRLLEELRAGAPVATTRRVHLVNRGLGAPKRTTARRDIAVFHRHGLVIQSGTDDSHSYLLTHDPAKGDR